MLLILLTIRYHTVIIIIIQNEWGDTALIEACGKGYMMIAALLIEKGAIVNYQNKVNLGKDVIMGSTHMQKIPVHSK